MYRYKNCSNFFNDKLVINGLFLKKKKHDCIIQIDMHAKISIKCNEYSHYSIWRNKTSHYSTWRNKTTGSSLLISI